MAFEGIKARRVLSRLKLKELEAIERTMNEASTSSLEDSDASQWIAMGGGDNRALEGQNQTTLRDRARYFFYKNPYGRNVIRLLVKYIVGRGFSITPDEDLPEVKDLLKKFWRKNKMNNRKKEIVRRTMRDGEVFIRKFQAEGILLLRFLKPELVKDPDSKRTTVGSVKYGIETDPNDVETVLAYWYNGKRIDASEVLHKKILVDSDVRRGRSFLEAISKYLVYYSEWIDRRVKMSLIRNAVALVKTVMGTSSKVDGVAAKFETKNKTAADGTNIQQVPKGVSMYVANKGVDYEFKTPNVQASDAQHDGRAILLGISAGAGLPEFMITSDASNASYSSTMVAEAPGTMEFEDWQEDFEDLFRDIYTAMIETAIAGQLLPSQIYDTEEVPVINTATGEKSIEKITVSRDLSTECSITFPELIHRDIKVETDALTMQKNNEWISDHTASARLDLNYEEEQDLIRRERENEEADPFSTDEEDPEEESGDEEA